MTIRFLSQTLINQIAAGEVIESPASVIKEAIENSIDAGATKIEITVRDSGKSYISILDNGRGMDKSDLEICMLKHTTSKLEQNNLNNINFLGFRGEALASIASVSKMVITTNNGHETWAIHSEGGTTKKLIPASLNSGTRVEVSEIFYNVPARLNFLKTDRGEMSSIIDVVERISLSHPEIEFILNDTLHFKPSSKLDRVCEVLGRDFKDNMIEIEASKYGFSINGYISRPTFNKGTSASQYFYVNSRSLKDKLITSSIRAAYMDTIEKGKFPLVCLWFTIAPTDIDVNVHPQKSEIRFKTQSQIRGLIISIIRKYLDEAPTNPTIINIAPTYKNDNVIDFTNTVMETSPHQQTFDNNILPISMTTATISNQDIVDKISYPLGLARGQVHNTYIISQVDDGIVVIDQHACHERIVYERIKKEMDDKGVIRQIMLIPEVVEMPQKQIASLMDIKDELERFGLVVDEFGKSAIVLREVPSILGEFDAQTLMKQLADDIFDFNRQTIIENKINMIAKTYACHTSIRAGKSLTVDEMNALLRQTENENNSGECNHGRRSYVKISLTELEKLFDR